jgi:Zn-dependent oligopeptidase
LTSNPHSRANPADRAEQQVEAYTLRLAGLSLREIAARMEVSHTHVANLIRAECEERVLPLADEVRQMEIDRFDSWLWKLHEQIEAGHQVARNIEVAVKVSERRARLLGVDAPAQAEVNTTVQHKPNEVLELIEQVRERVEEDEQRLREGDTQ